MRPGTANGEDHGMRLVSQRPRPDTPQPKNGSIKWSQAGRVAAIVAAAVGAAWLIQAELGSLSREMGEVRMQVEAIGERLERMDER